MTLLISPDQGAQPVTETITYTGELIVVRCWCGIRLAIPEALHRHAKESTKRNVHCPLGHTFVFRKSEADEQRERATAAEARSRHLEDQLRAAVAEGEATRVRLIRDRHRFANGVCPCCNRSFPNVARHMATQHPDYDASDLNAHQEPFTEHHYACSCGRKFETPYGLAIHQGRQRQAGWDDPATSKWRAHLTVSP